MGDRLLLFLAYESLRGTEAALGLLEQSPFQDHALLWLMSPSDLAEGEPPGSVEFSPWLIGHGASILESLQPRLAQGWLQMERQKLRIHQPEVMKRLGQLQQRILAAFFDAAESAGRKDLCRFFLIAMKQFLQELAAVPSPGEGSKLYPLDLSKLRMAERVEVYQSAACCFREMDRMDQWNREARATGFFDEGYAASQLWKAEWEQLDGDRLCALSRAKVNALDTLRIGNPHADGTTPNDVGGSIPSNST
jgi:hypothetical protein